MRACPPSAAPPLAPAPSPSPDPDPLAGLPPDLRERVERNLQDYPGQSVKKVLARIRRYDAAAASPGLRRLYRVIGAAVSLHERARRFYYAHRDCGCDFCVYVERDTLARRELFDPIMALICNLEAFNIVESEIPVLPEEKARYRKEETEPAARDEAEADAPAPAVVPAAE